MKLPRIMISGASSGSGKTMITCGLLQVFLNRGLQPAAFKCGPDYIDPMFHSKIIGAKSRNLDSYFTDENTTRYLFARAANQADISVMEGVMGFYDGITVSEKASSYELSKVTETPVILVVNCKGMSGSILALIKGFLTLKSDTLMKGVLLNQISEQLYPLIKEQIETELQVKVFGYIPTVKNLVIESRHLGLVRPEEVEDYHRKLNELAILFEKTIEIDELLRLADNTRELNAQAPVLPRLEKSVKIAVARDEAFCFYYEDNLQLLRDMGAELIEFSPIKDTELPIGSQGLILGGGYPELYAEALSNNTSMREAVRTALGKGIPCMAECGGFMYLHRSMENMRGQAFPMAGSIEGEVYKTNRLNRFGYIEITADKEQMLLAKDEAIRGHEFHYFESTCLGEDYKARKPLKGTEWNCIHGGDHRMLGFPHLYYYSNPMAAYRFLLKCKEWWSNVMSGAM
ncbi:MAG: cobyrinate a,c-diamide synthase [Mobilitalea sp.]